MEKQKSSNLIVGVDEKIGVGRAFLLGLQHVLAMDLYIVPIIIAGILAMDTGNTAFLIQMSFLAAGIATLIQTGKGIKLPVMQGPSYIPIGALTAIGSKLGLGAMIGSLIPGAIIIALFGYPLKWFAKLVQRFIPAIVGGTVIAVVGISLMPVAMTGIFTVQGNVQHGIIVSAVSAVLLIVCMMLAVKLKKAGAIIRLTSVIIAIAGGTIVASFFGMVSFQPVADAKWFSLPTFMPFGKPVFDISAILTMLVIYLILLIETTGTWFVVSTVTDKELTPEHLNRGAVGEGLGCAVGALFGGTPMTGYSTNAGIIAVTGVASRMAIMAGGVILVVLGLMPKLMNVIACIPGAVINGVFAVVCVVIAMNGFKVIQNVNMNERNMFVIGLPILLTIGAAVMPKELLYSLPSFLNYIFSSGMAVGAISAVLLNIVLPKEKEKTAL
ncbi:nucleobase:cation symporter-2 family protein [Metabacillus fastidiosus]|uniref:uracil-xanthine permease family protein n=1 Tax=Metabacillus fastidiosus TaxID=1458 RepID=UPI002E1B7B0D|nr:nucleobase:cation symporter-2 family protein [Metabacillus fastidiosus]